MKKRKKIQVYFNEKTFRDRGSKINENKRKTQRS